MNKFAIFTAEFLPTIIKVNKKAPLLYIICLTALFHFAFQSTSAQSSLFRNYTTKDGLPSLEVYHVMQDSKGYMWFSTDKGVSRFDGYEFRTFTTSEGLADNMVFECREDYKGRIWFRSTNKLSYYYHDSIFQLPINDTLSRVLRNSFITSLFVDSSDNIIIGAHGSPGILTIKLKPICAISIPYLEWGKNFVCCTGTAQALAGLTGMTDASHPFAEHDSLEHINVYTLYHDTIQLIKKYSWPRVELAIGSSIHSQALKMHDGKILTSLFSNLILLNKNNIELLHTFNTSILNLSPDKLGNVWITLAEGPPVLFSDGKFIEFKSLSFLKDKHITSVFDDTENGLWFTSRDNGVYYLNSLNIQKLTKETGLPWNKINNLVPAPNGDLWITSPTSSILAKLHDDSINYCSIPNSNSELSITGILFHQDKTIWIGTTLGLFVFHTSDLSKGVHLKTSGIRSELETGTGNVLINLRSSILLCKVEKDSLIVDNTIAMKVPVSAIAVDNEQRTWIGTFSGLWEFNNSAISYYGDKFPILKNRIVDIEKSSYGNLWMATPSNGVILKNKDNFQNITTQNGLLSNFCIHISIDYKGNVWVATAKGLSHIIIHTNSAGICHIDTIKNISSPDFSEINTIACVNNIIYVGTSTGLVYFDMDKLGSNQVPPPVYVTSIKINSKPTPVSKVPFNLHYDENYIAISYVGLTYHEAGNTQYRYKMEGIDTGWIYTRYTSVQYPKMPPGKYTFTVSAMNNDGLWNPSPASISFIINPPFWATWWARIIAISIIIGFIYWRIRIIERREKLKTDVNRQITNMELRVLRAQMDPHFLFNSLNTLTDLVEDNSNHAPKFVNELSKFYRYSFQHGSTQFVPLETEIKQVERYIFMLKIRFADNLKVTWKVDNRYMNYLLPIHSMQLLIENITKHNIISSDKHLWVEIMTTEEDSILIKNQLRKKDTRTTSNSLGLSAINDHYRLLTSKKINIISTSEFFSVELPLIKPDDYDNTHH